MSGVDYQQQLVTKQDLQRVERYASVAAQGYLGALNAIDTFSKYEAVAIVTATLDTMFATYFIAPRDQTVSSVTLFVQSADSGTTIAKQVAICSVGTVLDNPNLTVLSASTVLTNAFPTGPVSVPLTTPVSLVAGQQYAVVFGHTITGGTPTAATFAGISQAATASGIFNSNQRVSVSASPRVAFSVGGTIAMASTQANAIYARLT